MSSGAASRCAPTALRARPRSPAEIEELLRTILRRGVTGELGSDFRAAADEALLADGLAFGEGSPTELGTDTEWDLDAIEVEEMAAEEPATSDRLDLGFDRDGEEIVASRIQPDPRAGPDAELDYGSEPEEAAERFEPAASAEPPALERKQVTCD